MLRRLLLLLFIPAFLYAGVGRHVIVSGGISTPGSTALNANPGVAWTWQWAISASNTTLQPGDTVWVHAGQYMVDKDNGDIPRRAGNASFPIIYRAMPGEHVHLYSNRTPPWSPLQIEAAYTWWWGFDIYQTDVVTPNEAPAIGVNADYVKFINCTVHDAKSINITDYANTGTEVTGCIIYYGGRQTRICQHGYGGYIQNKLPSARKIYRHNDIFSNWDCGQQFYGSDQTSMNNISIDSNRYWNNGNLQGKLAGQQFQPNVLIGAGEATAAVVTGINFRGNLGYYSASPTGGNEFSMGYHGSGISGWNVSRNIMVSRGGSGFHFPEGYGGSTIQNNIVVGPTQAVVSQGTGNVGYASFAAAAAARSDDIIIYRNPYEPKRASVTVFNWDGSATVSFDPSSILTSGDAYEVRGATNFWNNVLASGTWTGGNITVTCANLTMAIPYGIPGTEPANGCGQTGASFNNPVNPQPYFMPMVLVGPYVEGTPVPQPPPVPQSLGATSILTTSFSANWGASTGATSYRLDVSTSSGFGSFVTGYNDLNVGNVTTRSVTGLSPSTTYYYRVRAVNANGTSASSGTITVVTAALPQPPSAPVAIAATSITPSSFVANWNASTTATAYFLDVSTGPTFAVILPAYNNLAVGNVLSTTVTGLSPSQAYYYRVRASNANGTSSNSNTITLTTSALPPDPPLPPVAVAADSITESTLKAQWNTSSGATGYYFDLSLSPSFSSFVPGYSNLAVGNVLFKHVTGLTASTTYYYRVRATGAGGTSASSNVITTTTSQPAVTPPAAPTAIIARDTTYSSFLARWNKVATATGYRLDVSTSNSFTSFLPGFNNVNAGSDSAFSVTGLTASTTYYFRVRAFNLGGVSANSNTITVVTLAEPPSIPAVPNAQAASSITDISFDANWQASVGATSYRLDVSMSPLFVPLLEIHTDLNVGNVIRYTVLGLSPTTTYYYRLRAVNGAGTSSSSNVITVVTGSPAVVPPPATVTTTATLISYDTFVAHWTPVATATGYRIDVSVVDSFSTFMPGYQNLDVGNVFELRVTGLSELKTYYYRVRSYNSAGPAANSNTTSVVTTARSNSRKVFLKKRP